MEQVRWCFFNTLWSVKRMVASVKHKLVLKMKGISDHFTLRLPFIQSSSYPSQYTGLQSSFFLSRITGN